MSASIAQRPGEAGSRRIVVELPTGVAPDPSRLGSFCSPAQFDLDQCPQASRAGWAAAQTPLLPQRLSGPVYLVRSQSAGLPEPWIRLQADGITLPVKGQVILGAQGTRAVFDRIPDVPLAHFELTLDGGRAGILTSSKNLCTSRLRARAEFEGHNRARHQTTVTPTVEGCPARMTATLTGKRRHTRLAIELAAAPGQTIKAATVRLPKTLALNPKTRRGLTIKTTARCDRGRGHRPARVQPAPATFAGRSPPARAPCLAVCRGAQPLLLAPGLP